MHLQVANSGYIMNRGKFHPCIFCSRYDILSAKHIFLPNSCRTASFLHVAHSENLCFETHRIKWKSRGFSGELISCERRSDDEKRTRISCRRGERSAPGCPAGLPGYDLSHAVPGQKESAQPLQCTEPDFLPESGRGRSIPPGSSGFQDRGLSCSTTAAR